MKRFVKIFLSFVLVFMFLNPIAIFATEIAAEGGQTTNHTIFTRLWEFAENNKGEVVSAIGSFLVLVASGIIKISNANGTKKLENTLNTIGLETAGTTKAQGSIINVLNQVITGENEMAQKVDTMYKAYEENQTIENDRNRLLGAVMVQVTTLIEMMFTIYVHNKHLPQGVKDLCVLKYANMQKALSDDELLFAIVESVREKINFKESEELISEEVSEEEAVI